MAEYYATTLGFLFGARSTKVTLGQHMKANRQKTERQKMERQKMERQRLEIVDGI